jgi:hypothetical protein
MVDPPPREASVFATSCAEPTARQERSDVTRRRDLPSSDYGMASKELMGAVIRLRQAAFTKFRRAMGYSVTSRPRLSLFAADTAASTAASIHAS